MRASVIDYKTSCILFSFGEKTNFCWVLSQKMSLGKNPKSQEIVNGFYHPYLEEFKWVNVWMFTMPRKDMHIHWNSQTPNPKRTWRLPSENYQRTQQWCQDPARERVRASGWEWEWTRNLCFVCLFFWEMCVRWSKVYACTHVFVWCMRERRKKLRRQFELSFVNQLFWQFLHTLSPYCPAILTRMPSSGFISRPT